MRNITYTLTRLSDNATVQYVTGGSTTSMDNFIDPYITVRKSTNVDGMKIAADSAIPSTAQYYTLVGRVLYSSGHTIDVTATLVIQDDSSIIVSSAKTSMYNPINAAWTAQFGSAIGKNSLYKIDLMALTHEIDFSTSGVDLPNFVTYNNDYLFKYLINCEGLVLDGCTSLTTETTISGNSVNQFDFSNMTKLKKFHA